MKGKTDLGAAVAPLFHAAASRALVVGGLPRLGASHARSLQTLLNALNASESAKASSGGVRRRAFWGSLSDEVDAEGSIRKVNTVSKNTSVDTLDEAVPSWYSIHNRHCTACQVPLLPGISSQSSTSNAVTCTLCGTFLTEQGLDRGTKKRLRACSVRTSRNKMHSRSQGKQCENHSRRATEPAPLIQPTIAALERRRDTTSQHKNEPPAAQTLDEKMKRKARRSKSNRAERAALTEDRARGEMECPESDTLAPFSTPHPSSLAAIDPYDEGKERLQKKRAHPLDPRAAQQHKRGKTSDDKAALRDLLSANRAKRQQADAARQDDTHQASSGLQDFLTSL